jgi:hypothetical protein
MLRGSQRGKPMAIRVECENCGSTFSVDEKHGGKTGKCAKCGNGIPIPIIAALATEEDEILDVLGKPAAYDSDLEPWEPLNVPTWVKFQSDGSSIFIRCAKCQSRLAQPGVRVLGFEGTLERLVHEAVACGWTIVPGPCGPGNEETFCPQCTARATSPTPACPKCGCAQIAAVPRGYSAGAGIVGELLFGPVGLVAGALDANQIRLVCTNCRHTW